MKVKVLIGYRGKLTKERWLEPGSEAEFSLEDARYLAAKDPPVVELLEDEEGAPLAPAKPTRSKKA